jgi:hypothetical protein
VIPQDQIGTYLDALFGRSSPGQALHHALIAAAGPDDMTPLGAVDPDKLHTSFVTLAPVGADINAETFVEQNLRRALTETRRAGRQAVFVGLAMELVMVAADGNPVTEDLARLLTDDRRLHEHPAAHEITHLFAACRDGRRWTGEHYVTGPRAGTIIGPTEHVGPTPFDRGRRERLILAAVGLA